MRIVIQFVIVLMLGINASYGDMVSGTGDESMSELVSDTAESSYIIDPPANATVIDFDDYILDPVLCFPADHRAAALRDRYAALGVTFDGPDVKDGGAILDECSGYDVSGHSPPNFLAFDTDYGFGSGGIPRGPETILFEPPVNHVQANVGSGWWQSGWITMEAFDASGASIDYDEVEYSPQLQTLLVQGSGITKVIVAFEDRLLVLDDLAFVQEKGWGLAYDVLFDRTSDLDTLRAYREEILSKNARGRLYKKLLYKNSEEALEVLLDNPELIAQAKDLIEANRDAVIDVLNGDVGVIYNTDEIITFLNTFAKKSPPRLKALAKLVKKGMLRKKRKGKLFLGFRLE